MRFGITLTSWVISKVEHLFQPLPSELRPLVHLLESSIFQSMRLLPQQAPPLLPPQVHQPLRFRLPLILEGDVWKRIQTVKTMVV